MSLQKLKCEQRGCCWSPLDERNVPWCFFPTNHGYTVESVTNPNPYGKSLFPLSLPCILTLVLSNGWKYFAFFLAYFRTTQHALSLSSSHFFLVHLLCLRHVCLWNMTLVAYQKTWLTLENSGFSIFCLISLPCVITVIV